MIEYIRPPIFIEFGEEVAYMEETVLQETKRETPQGKAVCVTIHYTDDGPSMEACMIAVLKAHMIENSNF